MRRMLSIAGTFAGFQFVMPMTGWFLVTRAAEKFEWFRPLIPWIALVLLLVIGIGLLQDAGIARFHLIAHSMGNTVAWAYFEIFGQQNVISYVLEEEAPCLLADPGWSEDEAKSYCGNILWPTFPGMDRGTVRNAFLDSLFHDHVNRDWRQEVKRIQLPTLILMGTASHYTCPPLWDWLKQNVRGSRFVSLEGGHNLHVDNEEGFLAEVAPFLREQN